jgi:hypothetical protein
MAMVFFMAAQVYASARRAGGVATFHHFRSALRHQRITARPAPGREMASTLPQPEDRIMIDTPQKPSVKDPGERWRRFLERVGTRSNDFASRLSRARFVYLHRRETATHWLPL